MNRYEVNGYTRISKATARKIYNGGGAVWFCPVNLRPGSMWHPEWRIVNNPADPVTFEKHVDRFTFYTCIDAETGRYIVFYVKG